MFSPTRVVSLSTAFLSGHREQPLDLARLLRLAINLATALGHAHQRGLIHKDVKPENVLVDDAGHVWLTGFGIASRLPRERQAPAPPEIIAGTLAYMSPEQTGRMNRSMDTRSDLYSLGVTLYQMLTGVLPFAAADPLEWVHCHIARQPVAPADRRAVPEPLSAIIMRLLAKNAEERYQTAAGLEADLRRCLSEWQSHGRIDPFPLGADDSSDRLLIPEKLYGREREVDALLAAFDRVVAQGTAELVLVSGYSGVGKSSVVNELHKVLVPPRGLFAAGKFDQYKRDIPYATLAQAFQMLVRQILVKSEAEVDQWRHALLEALGPNGQLMVNLIPEVEFVIGKQPPVADLPPQEARDRFQLVFRRFLGAFARPEHPLALFLDDLQWLDTATLELLERLITDPDVRHVLLIGAYRDNEVSSSHPLMRTLAAIREAGAKTQEIVLAPLGLEDVDRLIADALRCEPELRWSSGAVGPREDRRQSVLRNPVPHGAGRGRAAPVRPGCGSLDLGLGSDSRQGLLRQRGGSHGGEAAAIADSDADRSPATRLSRERGRDRDIEYGFRTIRRGDPHCASGCRPHRADPAPGGFLCLPPRPDSGGGLCAHPRKRARRGTPSDWTGAAGEHDGGRPRRTSVRCRQPTESGLPHC